MIKNKEYFLTAAVAAIVPAFFNDAFVVLLFLGAIDFFYFTFMSARAYETNNSSRTREMNKYLYIRRWRICLPKITNGHNYLK